MNLADEVAHIVRDSGARTAFVAGELLERIGREATEHLDHIAAATYSDYLPTNPICALPDLLRERRHASVGSAAIPWSQIVEQQLEATAVSIGPQDLAVLAYTSGTTGYPKGCIHTHGTMTATAVGAATWKDWALNRSH